MWRIRKQAARPDPETAKALEESRKAMAEVQAMRPAVHARHHRLIQLGIVLEGIREENHFSHKIFGEQ